MKKYSDLLEESTNSKVNLDFIEKDIQDLVKRNPMMSNPKWGKIQNDNSDKDTKPYEIHSFEEFKEKWYDKGYDNDKVTYALVRWLRYWCAKCDENIFCETYAVPNPNPKDHDWDIEFRNLGEADGMRFDVKSTRIPNGKDPDYYMAHPVELIEYYYEHQSKETRYGTQNRLFVVHIPTGNKSEMAVRCDFDAKRKKVAEYFDSIKEGRHFPYVININGKTVFSDVLFV